MAAGTPATFLFASEDGTFSAWNSTVDPNAVVVFSDPGSNYKGLAIHGDVLYSTDFAECKVEAFHGNFFDGSFAEFDTAGGFQDQSIPQGFCPFGIRAAGDSIFVTYALKDGDDDVPGIGHGFVRQFDADGNLVARVGSHGLLNSPWGLAMAPEDFGRFGGCLLVGNFGDGKLNAFCQNPARPVALRRPPAPPGSRDLDRRSLGHRLRQRRSRRPARRPVLCRRTRRESNGYYGKIEAVH